MNLIAVVFLPKRPDFFRLPNRHWSATFSIYCWDCKFLCLEGSERPVLVDIKGVKLNKDMICYCFEYTAEDIKQDYLNNSRSTIMEKIQTEKKFGNCQCAVKNPKGR